MNPQKCWYESSGCISIELTVYMLARQSFMVTQKAFSICQIFVQVLFCIYMVTWSNRHQSQETWCIVAEYMCSMYTLSNFQFKSYHCRKENTLHTAVSLYELLAVVHKVRKVKTCDHSSHTPLISCNNITFVERSETIDFSLAWSQDFHLCWKARFYCFVLVEKLLKGNHNSQLLCHYMNFWLWFTK